MDIITTAGVGALIGAIGAMVIASRRSKELARLIEEKLRGNAGGMTLPQLQEALELKGSASRNQLAAALKHMGSSKRVETIPAPPGTPEPENVNVIRYRLPV